MNPVFYSDSVHFQKYELQGEQKPLLYNAITTADRIENAPVQSPSILPANSSSRNHYTYRLLRMITINYRKHR
jgi:hypothetical protein